MGTFKDEAHKCSESIEDKESILKDVLEPYEPFRVVGKKVILLCQLLPSTLTPRMSGQNQEEVLEGFSKRPMSG